MFQATKEPFGADSLGLRAVRLPLDAFALPQV